jgi:hypothetical protein
MTGNSSIIKARAVSADVSMCVVTAAARLF